MRVSWVLQTRFGMYLDASCEPCVCFVIFLFSIEMVTGPFIIVFVVGPALKSCAAIETKFKSRGKRLFRSSGP